MRVLSRSGCAVQVVPNFCCGLPPYSYGDLETARALARRNIDIFRNVQVEAIVTDCGSCSTHLKEYAHLLGDDPTYTQAAKRFSAKVRDINQFLVRDVRMKEPDRRVKAIVTYHDPCHLSRYQGITDEPRALLQRIPGIAYRELPEADWCCGAAGTHNVTHCDQSMAVLRRKIERVNSTGAGVVVTSCPSCILQLRHGARKMGLALQVKHVTQVLDAVYAEREPQG